LGEATEAAWLQGDDVWALGLAADDGLVWDGFVGVAGQPRTQRVAGRNDGGAQPCPTVVTFAVDYEGQTVPASHIHWSSREVEIISAVDYVKAADGQNLKTKTWDENLGTDRTFTSFPFGLVA
jgi:hypothetical protein